MKNKDKKINFSIPGGPGKRWFSGGLLVLWLVSGAPLAAQDAKPESRKPNIVVFYVDDLGYGDLGSYGNTRYATPHLDQLAADGVRFTEFYAPAPACSASRAGFLTGRYAARYGMDHSVFFPDATTGLNLDELTLADLLKSAGYATGLFGKWHLGHQLAYLPLQRGFDEFNGTLFSNDMAVNARYEGNEIVDFDPDQRFYTRQFTEAAMDFMVRHRDGPFLVVITHPMPHVPLYVSPEFDGRSGAGLYGDVVQEIDWSVGRVRQRLADLGLAENTLVLFTSDNGPWLEFKDHGGSAGPLREGKLTTFEGGMRVPALAAWPGVIEADRVQTGVVSALDLVPTFAAWADAKLPEDLVLDGSDITSILLHGEPVPDDRTMAYFSGGELHALRVGDWKFIRAGNGRRQEWLDIGWPGAYPAHGELLFNLAEDPGEEHNQADSMPAKVAGMKVRMQEFMDAMGPLPDKIDMGKWKGDYTPDLEGAQAPVLVSREYRDREIARLKGQVEQSGH